MRFLTGLGLFLLPALVAAAEAPVAGPERIINVGSRRDRPALGYGWSIRERDRVRNFCWVSGLEADVWFDWTNAGSAELRVVAAPMYLDQRRQNIGVYVNDRFIQEWICPDDPGYTDYHAVIPAAALKEGRNRLTLRMGYARRPPRDTRHLSLAVDEIAIRPGSP
jgi:hypothetical protein